MQIYVAAPSKNGAILQTKSQGRRKLLGVISGLLLAAVCGVWYFQQADLQDKPSVSGEFETP